MEEIRIFWEKVKIPVLLLALTFLGGAVGYKVIYPNQDWTKIFFMTGITLTTVGYGDILGVESTAVGTWYTMCLMFAGMGFVLYSVSSITAFFVEGKLEEMLLIQSINRRVSKMKDHYIICGTGQTGIHVVRELYNSKVPFVVIDQDPLMRNLLRDEFPGCLVVTGDATSDAILSKANIETAVGLIATLPQDKDNLFLTVTARIMSSTIRIVSKAIDISMRTKLAMAGANYVVSPNFIGGMRMASEILRPHVVVFLDNMLRGKEKSHRIEEVVIPKGSPVAGRRLGDLSLREKVGINIIAYAENSSSEFLYNPTSDMRVSEYGILVFIGTAEHREKVISLVS